MSELPAEIPAGEPAQGDIAALQAQIDALNAAHAATAAAQAQAAADAEPKPPGLRDLIPNIGGAIGHALTIIADHLGL